MVKESEKKKEKKNEDLDLEKAIKELGYSFDRSDFFIRINSIIGEFVNKKLSVDEVFKRYYEALEKYFHDHKIATEKFIEHAFIIHLLLTIYVNNYIMWQVILKIVENIQEKIEIIEKKIVKD